MNRNLLILSAELVPEELQLYFGRLPSAMIPVENRTALDWVYHENVNHYNRIYLLVSKEAIFAKEHIDNMQYSIEVIEMDESSDLADSLNFGLNQIPGNDQLTIIFGDTFLPYMTNYIRNKDAIFYSNSTDSERWTVINYSPEKSISFVDKENLPKEDDFEVVIGVFHIMNPQGLVNILKTTPIEKSKSRFYIGLQKYFEKVDFSLIQSDNWVDYGHGDKYFEFKCNVPSRFFNNIEVDSNKGCVVKKSKHTEKFIDEINWYCKLPAELKEYLPEIFSYSTNPEDPFLKMGYCPFLTIHEIFVMGNLDLNNWRIIFSRLKDVLTHFKSYQNKLDCAKAQAYCYKMYVSKTIDRLNTFMEQGVLDSQKPININGVVYPPLSDYIRKLEVIISKEGLLECSDGLSIIHGDFCLTNILFDPLSQQVKLIDPRGSFGEPGIYGDPLYEWSKLAHSLNGGYDLIIEDKFNLVQYGNQIYYSLNSFEVQKKIAECFYNEFVPQSERRKVMLLESLLFLSMLPLHADNPKRQCIMLSRALELINPFIKNNYDSPRQNGSNRYRRHHLQVKTA